MKYFKGQKLWAKEDCMDNFRENQEVEITDIHPEGNGYLLDDAAYIREEHLKKYFSAEPAIKPQTNLLRTGTLVVNMFGGPGAGKSTLSAAVFTELKWLGVNAELVTEYAKDRVWEKSLETLNDQFYVSGKQNHKLHRLIGQVEVIITDSPILLGLYYGDNMPRSYKEVILDLYRNYDNYNYLVERNKEYNPSGRLQTEEEARDIDISVHDLLDNTGISYKKVLGTRIAVPHIVNEILEIIGRRCN